MTLQECYVKIGGDYNDILHRFMNENMVRKFVLKFPQDNNMALFEESWAKKDYETAFRAMHTLKRCCRKPWIYCTLQCQQCSDRKAPQPGIRQP